MREAVSLLNIAAMCSCGIPLTSEINSVEGVFLRVELYIEYFYRSRMSCMQKLDQMYTQFEQLSTCDNDFLITLTSTYTMYSVMF